MKITGLSFAVIGLTDDNDIANKREVALETLPITFDRGIGFYKGLKEHVAIVWNVGTRVESFLTSLGFEWGEESILVVDANREAYIVTCIDGKSTRVGPWRRVWGSEVENFDAWTQYEGNYYVAG